MTDLKPGSQVRTADGTRATFIKYTGAPAGAPPRQAIIQVGYDTRVVDPVGLEAVQ